MPRGRKLDDQKRLNRQLINQRAFRERRTARLTELEERKNQLEVENAQLRGNHIRTEGDTTQTSRVPVPCPSCLTHDTHRDELKTAFEQVANVYSTLMQFSENLKKALGGNHLTASEEKDIVQLEYQNMAPSPLSCHIPETVHHISARQSPEHFSIEQSIEVFDQQSEKLLDGLLQPMNGVPMHQSQCCLGIPGCNTVEHCPFHVSNSSLATG